MSPTHEEEIQASDEQRAAVRMVDQQKISILIGGPGTGKTFTTKLILEYADDRNLKVLMAAPTGKAAKKMQEATGRKATTIHAMLECTFDSGQFSFKHNAEKPLHADLIILDEVSMVSLDIMASVMAAIDIKQTKLLLIGDQDQLPSVGAGAVLRDMLASALVPFTSLTKTFRYCGEIVRVCHKIKVGELYKAKKKLDLEAEDKINLIHIEMSTQAKTRETVLDLVTRVIPGKGFNPIDDIQVLSPVNDSGELSCKALNEALREKLNPLPDTNFFDPGGNDWTYHFRVGDRVINTKNRAVDKTDARETNIVNGDLGIIKKVSKKEMVILFADPDREVIMKRENNTLLHAYCITCHKFQGSEAPVIIIPLHRQFDMFLSNAWIYTALSRGKNIVITVGAWATIEKAIKNRQPNKRFTMLTEEILKAENDLYDI